MKKIILAVFLLFVIGKEVMSQDCSQNGESCEDGKPCCDGLGVGVCKRLEYGPPLCLCVNDGWLASCSSHAECCKGYCNSRGYCGCIESGRWCTHGQSEECCGRPSITDGHLIKTCTKAVPLHDECY
ncbi:keratin-associated protein 5-1-like [Bradysia coprophila]|uniref:keratin-associated protein 5-1-like n=1 Tax=Bradysia coprophila TaxID=38358 RepID=UPI00187D9B93|nr:keratin-associated protein 5-1-like [Bradysia coprophila]